MTSELPNQEPEKAASQPIYEDRFSRRQRRRAERWEARSADTGSRSGRGGWIIGVVLIAVGILVLLQNLNVFIVNNWWALFILIPALGALGAAYRMYQNAGGRLTAEARGSLFLGLVLTLVAAVFLFNLNWTILGPVLIILAGVGLLVNTVLPK